MIGTLAALTLFTLSFVHSVVDSQQMSVTVAEPGHSVTLQCRFSDNKSKFLYWNKETLGHLPQIVAEVVFGQANVIEEFKGSRFSARTVEDLHFFTITNVTKEDEAVYFCQGRAAYGQTYINGTFLSVIDGNQLKPVYVRQHPETEWVRPGDSVTMNCSLVSNNNVQCPSEHSVYWFRAGPSGFSPGVIHRHRTDEEETGCVYSLSRTIQDSSDAGTYYCAVVTCGRILFGNGTKVETRTASSPLVAALGGLLACCGAVITILICYIAQTKACVCKGTRSLFHHKTPTVDQSNDLVGEAPVMNYAALDFSSRRMKKGTMNALPQEGFYSVVRAEDPNQR